MKVFAILYCYPPILVPASLCYLKHVAGLRERGVEVDVLSIEPSSFEAPNAGLHDGSLEKLMPSGVTNYRVRSLETNFFLKSLKRFGPGYDLFYKTFEPKKKEWVSPAVKFIDRHDMRGYDVILSCSQPHVNHLIGLYLKEKTSKPWVAYLSDPWSDNPYASYRSEKIRGYHKELESKVVEKADRVLFTSEEMLKFVMRKYPSGMASKCAVVPHCFVREWYGAADPVTERGAKIRFLHTGHFYGIRTPMPLFRALARLNGELPVGETAEFLFFGKMADEFQEYLRANRMDFVKVMDTIPYLKSLAEMRQADYLLLIDAPLGSSSESIFLPSKLVDYIGSSKPIIGITPSSGASARVLRETGNMVCPIEDEEKIYSFVKQSIANFRRSAQAAPSYGDGGFDSAAVALKFENELKSVMK
jgi:glycosyltransferase involved in cell wall biosynthesis